MENSSCGHPPSSIFHLFPQLPLEIRLQIWSDSFLPRVLELHARRAHYADNSNFDTHGRNHRPPAFQSRCYNPAALSVNVEARNVALGVYTVALPLALEKYQRFHDDQPGDLVLDDRRVLYIALDRDTIVLVGEEPAARVTRLVSWFRQNDALGNRPVGLRNICISAGHFAHNHGAQMLRVIGRQLFPDVNNFALVIGSSAMKKAPPAWWVGGRCFLHEFPSRVEGGEGEDENYKAFVTGVGRQFREGDGWMVIGKTEIRIVGLRFENTW